MRGYESNYQTASEYLYYENLYKVRGYGPYKRNQHVIPDPPDAWQHQWAEKNGRKIRDDASSKLPEITSEQEAKGTEHLKRLESVSIKDEKGEIVAFSDANLLSEFQVWLAKENLCVTEEMAQAIRDSWTRLFEEDGKARAVAAETESAGYKEMD